MCPLTHHFDLIISIDHRRFSPSSFPHSQPRPATAPGMMMCHQGPLLQGHSLLQGVADLAGVWTTCVLVITCCFYSLPPSVCLPICLSLSLPLSLSVCALEFVCAGGGGSLLNWRLRVLRGAAGTGRTMTVTPWCVCDFVCWCQRVWSCACLQRSHRVQINQRSVHSYLRSACVQPSMLSTGDTPAVTHQASHPQHAECHQ